MTGKLKTNDPCTLFPCRVKAEHTYEVHEKSLRTVSVHPTQTDVFCTAGVAG